MLKERFRKFTLTITKEGAVLKGKDCVRDSTALKT